MTAAFSGRMELVDERCRVALDTVGITAAFVFRTLDRELLLMLIDVRRRNLQIQRRTPGVAAIVAGDAPHAVVAISEPVASELADLLRVGRRTVLADAISPAIDAKAFAHEGVRYQLVRSGERYSLSVDGPHLRYCIAAFRTQDVHPQVRGAHAHVLIGPPHEGSSAMARVPLPVASWIAHGIGQARSFNERLRVASCQSKAAG